MTGLPAGAGLHVVLVRPEIPPNTGNVIRLCANTGCRLHLVEPLGFAIDDARMRRAGLDYHEWVEVQRHPDWAAWLAHWHATRDDGARLHAFSAHGRRCDDPAGGAWRRGDAVVFGAESSGLPAEVRASVGDERLWRLPMRPGQRSLNLSNAVAVVVFDAWRRAGYDGAAGVGVGVGDG